MNLDHLRYFEAIARLEHYGKAAAQLHVTQPNLSHAVSQLELELGVPLFEKTGRNVRLTRYGRQFLESVTYSLEYLDGSVRSLQELKSGGGLVVLGCTRNLGASTVPALMRSFCQTPQGKRVTFQLHTTSSFSSVLLDQASQGNYDMVFTSQPGDAAVFDSVPFSQSPFVVAVPLGHPLSCFETVDLRDTLAYSHIFLSRSTGLRASVDALFHQIGASPKISYETEEDFVAAGLAEADFGIAVLPDHPLLHIMKLKLLPISWPDPGRAAYLSMPRQVWRSQAAIHFYEFCLHTLKERPATAAAP